MATITALNHALSLVPRINSNDINTTITTAGRLATPWIRDPSARISASNGESANCRGNAQPSWSQNFTKYADQLTATVAAPMAYSMTRSQPMIQASNSPMVA